MRSGDASTAESSLIGGKDRARLEWMLLHNLDVFTAGGDAAIFCDPNDDGASDQRRFRLRMTTPIGTMSVGCTVARQADRRWLVTDLTPPDEPAKYPACSDVGSMVQTLLSFHNPVPIALQTLILARLNSNAFRQLAVADAGLSGAVSPALVGQVWAVGWSNDGLELYSGWNGGALVPELFVRARMASLALPAALDCRAKAEAAAAVLSTLPQLPTNQRLNLLRELVTTGDDEVTLPALDQMAATSGRQSLREMLRQLEAYVRHHPATPALVADACIYDQMTNGGIFSGTHMAYTDAIIAALDARLTAAGLATESFGRVKYELQNDREVAFDRAIPRYLREDDAH